MAQHTPGYSLERDRRELERLRSVNAELLAALTTIANGYENPLVSHKDYRVQAAQIARAAIAKAAATAPAADAKGGGVRHG